MPHKTNYYALTGLVLLAGVIATISIMYSPKDGSEVANKPITVGDASLTLISPIGGTIEVGDQQSVHWTSKNYSAPTVKINIVRKVSDNPATYELVRTVAASTKNDGNAVWVPAKSDIGPDMFVEVACASTAQSCRASAPTASLAVIDSNRFANTASAFQAIEASNNR